MSTEPIPARLVRSLLGEHAWSQDAWRVAVDIRRGVSTSEQCLRCGAEIMSVIDKRLPCEPS